MLKPCPYRDSKGSQLKCTITEDVEKTFTSSTSNSICSKCKIPDIFQQVNCRNLVLGKLHYESGMQNPYAMQNDYVNETCFRINCQAVSFDSQDDYQKKCSQNCSAFQPMHRSLLDEDLILIPNSDSAKATDRNLRQAILAILYSYHNKHPERYSLFDVTPEFIAKSLGIQISDVMRVVLPMEEEGELVTKRYLGEAYFRYVTITAKGITMIDERPLFGRLDTAQVRAMETYINIEKLDNINNSNISNFDLKEARFGGNLIDAQTINANDISGSIANGASQQTEPGLEE